MRIAVLYDVHANLPALQAVLEEIERRGVDRILFGGDLAWGPMPSATMDAILGLGDLALFVRGNADREVATRADVNDGLEENTAAVNVWCADRLTDEQRTFLAEQPESVRLSLAGLGEILFCHGSPRSDEEPLKDDTPAERLKELFTEAGCPTIVCGHTHRPLDRRVSGVGRVINPGSVGLPQGPRGAYWALFDDDDVRFERTDYDFAAAAAAIEHTGVPLAGEFAEHILQGAS